MSGTGAATAVTISGVPSGWTLNQGSDNGEGSWSVTTSDPSSLYISPPSTFVGAAVLNVSETWTNADGSTGTAFVSDNVEAYAPGSPIFAVSGDDTLTGSASSDGFVFAQPIGEDTIYNFDAAADAIDLIGFAGFASFADVVAHLASDAKGNAVLTLGSGESITLAGVGAGALGGGNFTFDVEPTMANPGTMTIGNGAILPLGGTIDNIGTITLGSTGDETDLEVLIHELTLEGGGRLTLSDNAANNVFAADPNAVLANVDNTIAGAGQLGAGQLTLHNEAGGTIAATGSNPLVIDTGATPILNTGLLQASGAGGMVVKSPVSGGQAEIGGGSSIEFAAASHAAVTFDGGMNALSAGMLKLDQAGAFDGAIGGFTGYDAIDLVDLVDGEATISYAASANSSGGMLTLGDAAQTHSVTLALLGQYAAATDFAVASDGHGGTLVTLADPSQNHTATVVNASH
jgi:hypothetical protein